MNYTRPGNYSRGLSNEWRAFDRNPHVRGNMRLSAGTVHRLIPECLHLPHTNGKIDHFTTFPMHRVRYPVDLQGSNGLKLHNVRGRCRYCNARISPRYLLIELLTGFVYVIVYLRYGISVETLALLYLFSILRAVFFIDLEHMIIPNGLVLLGMAGGALVMVYNLFVPFSLYQPSRWYTPLIGMVSASGILFAIALVAADIPK